MNENELLANAITKALAYQENGGKVNLNKTVAGKSGEMKSIFQFTPATWKQYSKQIFGHEVPLNNDNETHVVQQKVLKWINEGKTTSQIASMWNAGESHPDAYKENWRGTNSHGVAYDTPAYATNVLNYATKFYKENTKQSQSPELEQQSVTMTPNNQYGGLLGKSMSESELKV